MKKYEFEMNLWQSNTKLLVWAVIIFIEFVCVGIKKNLTLVLSELIIVHCISNA